MEDEEDKEAKVVVEVAKEYWPQAVVDWHLMGVNPEYQSIYTSKEVKKKAKQHLSFLGWKFRYAFKSFNQRLELRYVSPSGRSYNSLRTACSACIQHGAVALPSNNSTTTTLSDCRDVVSSSPCEPNSRKRPSMDPTAPTPQKRTNRACRKLTGKTLVDLESENPTSSLSSCSSSGAVKPEKLITPGGGGRGKKTVITLCWLIDNNVVEPGAKVKYRSRKATGKITREGILCDCCSNLFALSEFEKHAGSTNHRPAANIILEDDGRSLSECKLQYQSIRHQIRRTTTTTTTRSSSCDTEQQIIGGDPSDDICSVCRYQGDLVICDRCPSTFHPNCVGLSQVPDDEWICPSCCCGACGRFDENLLVCHQCELQFHDACVQDTARTVDFQGRQSRENWFCSVGCETVCLGLEDILGKPIPVGDGSLTWTLLKSKNLMSSASLESSQKLITAVKAIHECFEPCKDPYSNRDVIEDVVFNNESALRRLDFKGFYIAVLEKGDDLVSVATLRIRGEKLAEMPLVATRFQYRRLGMCTLLLKEVERQISDLGVERLTLPAIAASLETWIRRFGFSVMTPGERSQLLKFPFLDFPDTVMCHKFLQRSPRSIISYHSITQADEQSADQFALSKS